MLALVLNIKVFWGVFPDIALVIALYLKRQKQHAFALSRVSAKLKEVQIVIGHTLGQNGFHE